MELASPEYTDRPWHYCYWNGKISVAFGYAASGWILMAILTTAYNQSVVVQCSEVFDPFPDMQGWLERIAGKQLPADWEINEEGQIKLLRALSDENDQLDFQVWSYPDDKNPNYPPQLELRARIDRLQLLKEFCRRFNQYTKEDFDPSQWPEELEGFQLARDNIFDLRRIDLSGVQRRGNK